MKNDEIFKTLFRFFLTSAGTYLVSRGYLDAGSASALGASAETFVGAAAALGSALWSIKNARDKARLEADRPR